LLNALSVEKDDALSAGIYSIKNAPLLTPEQKRDILYNNAARFLRLKPRP
jgi:uncharacterized protein